MLREHRGPLRTAFRGFRHASPHHNLPAEIRCMEQVGPEVEPETEIPGGTQRENRWHPLPRSACGGLIEGERRPFLVNLLLN